MRAATFEGYYAWRHDAKTIEARFTEVANWAKRNKLPPERIFLGEFGVLQRTPSTPGVRCLDRETWISAVRVAAEKQHFRWAFFNINGQFGLLSDAGPPSLDPAILGSLGLRRSVSCKIE